MKRLFFKYYLILSTFIVLSSCIQNTAKEIKNWIENQETTGNIPGEYTFLSEDGIKVYLPSVFKKYSLLDYQKELKLLVSDEAYKDESKRLTLLRKMKGHFYVFYDRVTGSTYSMNTMPYTPLTKRDAQYLLGMIRINNETYAESSDLEFTKITAKYDDKSGPQIFKVIHRIDNKKTNATTYNSTYIVSHNKKTVYIQLATGYEVNFDPYLKKMIL